MPNRLAEATSPYLLQHKDNPVNWFQWSDEAFALAKKEDKPIFLSVGYSACHWCHVMEHESFENERIAAILNEHFVSIKVDREERPDIDQIYMQAVQMLTGSGGWPMSVFLRPDGQPFFGGTYWPPETKFGRPGFGQVLTTVADAWKNKREQLEQQSEQITQHLRESGSQCRTAFERTSHYSRSLASTQFRRNVWWFWQRAQVSACDGPVAAPGTKRSNTYGFSQADRNANTRQNGRRWDL
jgi:uncharacterized protein YyaL (SSP411 family)